MRKEAIYRLSGVCRVLYLWIPSELTVYKFKARDEHAWIEIYLGDAARFDQLAHPKKGTSSSLPTAPGILFLFVFFIFLYYV